MKSEKNVYDKLHLEIHKSFVIFRKTDKNTNKAESKALFDVIHET